MWIWTNYNNELYHHGIKGQKWGLRRYQNEDGTLTEEGRRRYNSDRDYYFNSKDINKYYDSAKRGARNAEKIVDEYAKDLKSYKQQDRSYRKASRKATNFLSRHQEENQRNFQNLDIVLDNKFRDQNQKRYSEVNKAAQKVNDSYDKLYSQVSKYLMKDLKRRHPEDEQEVIVRYYDWLLDDILGNKQ